MGSGLPKQNLKGKSARIIVAMAMPGFACRQKFGAHGVRGLKKSIPDMAGVRLIRRTLIGGLGALNPKMAGDLLRQMRSQGGRTA